MESKQGASKKGRPTENSGNGGTKTPILRDGNKAYEVERPFFEPDGGPQMPIEMAKKQFLAQISEQQQ